MMMSCDFCKKEEEITNSFFDLHLCTTCLSGDVIKNNETKSKTYIIKRHSYGMGDENTNFLFQLEIECANDSWDEISFTRFVNADAGESNFYSIVNPWSHPDFEDSLNDFLKIEGVQKLLTTLTCWDFIVTAKEKILSARRLSKETNIPSVNELARALTALHRHLEFFKTTK
ncbi:hypothetical protein KKF34_15030 [Myxococcota bacterium]|nr:hypothetical protein [Myxococcota bacterium]MBU1498190.1 hypothetical protein [Myxococcota bacterium]